MYVQGSTWQRRQAVAQARGGDNTGHNSIGLRARAVIWETFPLSRKCCFLPVTQPWPGNLCRTACDCLCPQAWPPGHAPAQPPGPQPLCTGSAQPGVRRFREGSQRRRCRLRSLQAYPIALASRWVKGHLAPRKTRRTWAAQTSQSPSPC